MLLSIKDYIDRAENTDVVSRKAVYVPGLGGEIEVVRQPLTDFMELSDRVSKAKSARETLDANVEIIYDFCPILHDHQIQAAYECKEPLDVVRKVFGDNLEDMGVVLTAIAGFYGNPEEEIKNG